MSHRINLLSLIENKSAFTNHAQQRIIACASSFFPNAGSFVIHNNAKEMFKGLSNAFSNSDIVIIGADTSLFLSFKRLLLQALSLEGESNSDIQGVVSKNHEKVSETLALSHALVPKDSTVFISEDGLFSGFAKKSGNQHLIVLPLDPNRIESIIENGLYSYFKQLTTDSEYPADVTNADDEYASQAVKALLASNLSVAIASTKTSAFIKSTVNDVLDFEEVFKFLDCNQERNNLSQKEFVANLANQAREIGICALGAAISNVFASEKEGGRLFVFVTIADTMRARVAKVFAEPGETPRMLVEAAVDTLLNMLINYTQVGGFEGFPSREEIPDASPEEVKTKKKIAVKVILSGVVALLLCLVIIFFSAKVATAIRNNSKNGNGAVVIHNLTQTLSDISISSQQAGIYREVYTDSSTTGFVTSVTSQPGKTTVKPLIISTIPLATSTRPIVTTIKPKIITTKPIITTSKPKVITTKPITTTIKPIVTTTKPKVTTTKLVTTTTKPVSTTIKPIVTTTKAPVTTTKSPTTTSLSTTTTSATTTISTTTMQSIGTFSFTVKGYGHGVGMSQQGAKAFAAQGKSYKEILLHYYNVNITLQDDANKPASVFYDGVSIPLNTYLARTTAAEIGTCAPI